MDDGKHRVWDIGLRIIGGTLVIAGLVLGWLKFSDSVENEKFSPVWESRLSAYGDLINLANEASLASLEEKEDYKEEIGKLFRGRLVVFGQNAVILQTAYLWNYLDDCIETKTCNQGELLNLSTSLAECARYSIGTGWDDDFEVLAGVSPMTIQISEEDAKSESDANFCSTKQAQTIQSKLRSRISESQSDAVDGSESSPG